MRICREKPYHCPVSSHTTFISLCDITKLMMKIRIIKYLFFLVLVEVSKISLSCLLIIFDIDIIMFY